MSTFNPVLCFHPAPEVGQVDVPGGAATEQMLCVPERNASNESLEVAGVKKTSAIRVLFVLLEYGFQ